MRERHKNARAAAEAQDMKRKHMQAGQGGAGLVAVAWLNIHGCMVHTVVGAGSGAGWRLGLKTDAGRPEAVHQPAAWRDLGQLSFLPSLPSCPPRPCPLQAFIDKFRYNANRAALVQSRIKALERLAGEGGALAVCCAVLCVCVCVWRHVCACGCVGRGTRLRGLGRPGVAAASPVSPSRTLFRDTCAQHPPSPSFPHTCPLRRCGGGGARPRLHLPLPHAARRR